MLIHKKEPEYYRVQNDTINYIISIVKRSTVIKTSKNSHSCLLGEFSEEFLSVLFSDVSLTVATWRGLNLRNVWPSFLHYSFEGERLLLTRVHHSKLSLNKIAVKTNRKQWNDNN